MIDTTSYRNPDIFKKAAEEILSELRDCPPAKGFDNVEFLENEKRK